jgi:NADPH-dependent 2,4-dienoyl-CoA reductase/sulfur reductase-like enzyme
VPIYINISLIIIVGTIFNSETIIIYVDNVRVRAININNNNILLTDGGIIYDYLYPDGNLICNCDI